MVQTLFDKKILSKTEEAVKKCPISMSSVNLGRSKVSNTKK